MLNITSLIGWQITNDSMTEAICNTACVTIMNVVLCISIRLTSLMYFSPLKLANVFIMSETSFLFKMKIKYDAFCHTDYLHLLYCSINGT